MSGYFGCLPRSFINIMAYISVVYILPSTNPASHVDFCIDCPILDDL